MWEDILWEDISYGRTSITGGHVLWEDMCYERTCFILWHVLPLDMSSSNTCSPVSMVEQSYRRIFVIHEDSLQCSICVSRLNLLR